MSTQTLLIVDDEAAIRDMLRMALEAAGFRCIEAVNIQEAYRTIIYGVAARQGRDGFSEAESFS